MFYGAYILFPYPIGWIWCRQWWSCRLLIYISYIYLNFSYISIFTWTSHIYQGTLFTGWEQNRQWIIEITYCTFSVPLRQSVRCPNYHVKSSSRCFHDPGHSLSSLNNKTKRSYNSRKQVVWWQISSSYNVTLTSDSYYSPLIQLNYYM